MSVEPVEQRWLVHGLELAGLAWGDPQSPPVLALHGWLDNAASFAPLAQELAEQFYVVALDLTGHGHSDWRSPDATYQVYDDLPQIRGVIQQFDWSTFTLLGHSRGAIIASLYAASFPESVGRLLLLDGAVPKPLEAAGFVDQLRRFVLEKDRFLQRKPRVYASVEAAVAQRAEQSLDLASAQLLASRNLRPCEGGVCWRTDPRLRGASAMKMTREQIATLLGALSMPTLLCRAQMGLAADFVEAFTHLLAPAPALQVETFPGGHHFHMEEGVVKLAQRIQHFVLQDK